MRKSLVKVNKINNIKFHIYMKGKENKTRLTLAAKGEKYMKRKNTITNYLKETVEQATLKQLAADLRDDYISLDQYHDIKQWLDAGGFNELVNDMKVGVQPKEIEAQTAAYWEVFNAFACIKDTIVKKIDAAENKYDRADWTEVYINFDKVSRNLLKDLEV